jgi:N-acetylglucosaminyldiphosphoundecaprenol N-acetyl-beta-D-mannosaminyltransferase
MAATFGKIALCGMDLACLENDQLLDHIFAELAAGRGGWLVTANLDFLRRHVHDPEARAIYAGADLRVADGMPLVWASRLRGTPLPARIAGSSLVLPLCERAARAGKRVYLLGGEAEANRLAAERLQRECPGLVIAGRSSPLVGAPPSSSQVAELRAELLTTKPDIVLVAFGSPKQEHVIAALRSSLPNAWWAGVGISFSFLAGSVKRAPKLVQDMGLEWVHRLVQEPGRLFRRYVIEDLPFAFELFGRAMLERLRGVEASPAAPEPNVEARSSTRQQNVDG